MALQNVALGSAPNSPVIHRAVGRGFVGTNHAPWLSIKCMFGGAAYYHTGDGQHYRIGDDDFLVLNHGHVYTVEKPIMERVESFCVFLPPDLVAEVADARLPRGALKLEPSVPSTSFELYEHRRPQRGPISRRVLGLRRRLIRVNLSDEYLQEQLVELAVDLVQEHLRLEDRVSALPWAKQATRSELFRRVHIGRDYLHAHLDAPFSLEKTARAATLSRYHFLRAFREVFGLTPLRYVQDLRLHRATALLAQSRQTVTAIALDVGYDSVAAFSSFFSNRTGLSPSAWRSAHRKKQYR